MDEVSKGRSPQAPCVNRKSDSSGVMLTSKIDLGEQLETCACMHDVCNKLLRSFSRARSQESSCKLARALANLDVPTRKDIKLGCDARPGLTQEPNMNGLVLGPTEQT